MAKTAVSMAKKTKPKRPDLTAPQSQWDTYERKLKEYEDHDKKRKTELNRRRGVGRSKRK